MYDNRTLVRSDNLDIMRDLPDESIDLIATDPPFNSKRDYFIPYRDESGQAPDTLVKAFSDTWTWGPAAEDAYDHLIVETGGQIGDVIQGLRTFLNELPMMAYLVMMATRIVEMHRILKPTGSLYLHCDPSASHYLKIILDATFGPTKKNFRNEVIWKRTSSRSHGRQYGRVHDVILFYSKTEKYKWNPVYTPNDPEYLEKVYRHEDERGRYRIGDLTGGNVAQKGESGQTWRGVNPSDVGRNWSAPRREAWPEGVKPPENYESLSVHEKLDVLDANGLIYWPPRGNMPGFKRYLSTSKGRKVDDMITDIKPLSSHSKERTGYPTQKPVELYERLITASSNEGALVLDPFCGCGTTLMAAESLNRNWIGIDLTYMAIGAVNQQFEKLFPQHRDAVTITGTPENAEQALVLASSDPQGFEEWCVTHVLKFRSNAKKVADGGIDGTYMFPIGRVKGKQAYGKVVAQVKGGKSMLGHIRDFRTAMENVGADLGVFVVTKPPSPGMLREASLSGTYRHPFLRMEAQRVQIYEIQDYFNGSLPILPFGERDVL